MSNRLAMRGVVCLTALSAFAAAHGAIRRTAPAPPAAATQPAPASRPSAPVWHTSMGDAVRAALKARRPIFLVIGAEWCAPCKVLEQEMRTPGVAKALEGWTLVHLDVDASEEAPALLESGAIPLLRVLSPAGTRVDVREGLTDAAELLKWLASSYEKAIGAAGAEDLLGEDAPDAATLAKLIPHLADAAAATREAAIRRLQPHPGVAAKAVVETFAKGNLITRLAAIDLLTAWNAPVGEMDPWRPETVTPERLEALAGWATAAHARPATAPASRPSALTPRELTDARAELTRLASATSEDEARGIRERLARVGVALLPEIRARLADPGLADAPRARLTALRYRLVATDALALGWPTGLERLAAVDLVTRRTAAEELAARAGPGDGPLLLELFADPDALIREISLRGLQAIGKGDTSGAIARLLTDPDLNVRAAVLKQLARSPDPTMLSTVTAFAKRESDPDLIVYAIRVLRESKADRAIDGLLELLAHANWRVRAEAAEALTELVGHRSGNATPQRQAQVYAAMAGLLDDPESFVVSRAVIALADADLPSVVDPMIKAAQKHPELAGDVIRGLTAGSNVKRSADRHLREFCGHASAAVRAQAIDALCANSSNVQAEVTTLLKDPEPSVRAATAAALFKLINSWRPAGRGETRVESTWFGLSKRVVEDKTDPWGWVADVKSGGKSRPAWMADLLPDLQKLADASSGSESRVQAALLMLALGHDEPALKVLREATRAEPRFADQAAGALPWLATEPPIELFKFLAGLKSAGENVSHLTEAVATLPDPKVASAIWDLLGPTAPIEMAGAAIYGLRQLYFGERYFMGADRQPKDVLDRVIADAKGHLAGTGMQRIVALTLLLSVAPTDAADAARAIRGAASTPADLRADAFQFLLLAEPRSQGEKDAIAAVTPSSPPAERRTAVTFLASGAEAIQLLRGSIYLQISNPTFESTFTSQSAPVVLAPPPGLTADPIKPLLTDEDPQVAAAAGYLLALWGDRSGFDAVVLNWRAKVDDDPARRLLYRAAAALREDNLTPLLEEVYRSYGKERNYMMGDFYWTIRNINGEKILKLRKTIRDEVGMENLR